MEDYAGNPWKSEKIEKTKILPLRWISNWLSTVATKHLTKAFDLEEDNNVGWKYKYHAKMFKYLYKPYEKWGTTYRIDLERLKSWYDESLDKDSK